jgi:molybdate transport system substrate-binding protein
MGDAHFGDEYHELILTGMMLLGFAIAVPTFSKAAEIKLLSAAALRPSYAEILTQFERDTGHHVNVAYGAVGPQTDRLKKGEPADVAIVTDIQIDELQKLSKIVVGSRLDVARVGVGVFVRKNNPKPDISSVDAFKRTLLTAKTITYSDSAFGGAAGIYVAQLIDRLGIAAEIKRKTKLYPGNLLYQVVAGGEAELGFDQVSLILEQPTVELVGPLPAPIQYYTTFTAGIGATSDQSEAGKALITFLASPSAQARMKAKGFDFGKN